MCKVKNYEEYLVKLKETFGYAIEMPEHKTIQDFIDSNNLYEDWEINLSEVEQDIQDHILAEEEQDYQDDKLTEGEQGTQDNILEDKITSYKFMMNINPKKTVACIFLFAMLCLAAGGCGYSYEKSNPVDDLKAKGYVVSETSDNTFCVTEDGVDYYFKQGVFGPTFSYAVTDIPYLDENSEETGTWANITIENDYGSKINVAVSRLKINDETGETEFHGSTFFRFKKDFTEENLNTNGFADILGDYRWFKLNYLTEQDLQDIFDRGFGLAEEISQ